MLSFVGRRTLGLIPTLWGLATIVFLMLTLLPGDTATVLLSFRYTEEAAEALREQLGLNDPIWIQYIEYWGRLLQGDLGTSAVTNVAVTTAIWEQFPATIALAVTGMVIAMILGVAGGVCAAVRHRTWLDASTIVVSTLGLSIPTFFFGILLILLFGVMLGWVPVVGGTGFGGLILPALAVALPAAGYIARTVRSSMLEVLGAEYLVTARQKGLRESKIIVRHALRNALIPIITVIGLLFGQLIGGAIVVENVFARPGIGRLLVNAIQQRDIPLVQGCVLLIGFTYLMVNLIVDITYGAIDPRIRLSRGAASE